MTFSQNKSIKLVNAKYIFQVPKGVQDALFMMAVANSCVNPLSEFNKKSRSHSLFSGKFHNIFFSFVIKVYGSFTKNCCGLTKQLNRNRSRPSTIKEALESHASNN